MWTGAPASGTARWGNRHREQAVQEAGRSGSWRAPFRFFASIGSRNPPLAPPRRGTDRARTFACSPPGSGRGWVGSWKARLRLCVCIGAMKPSVGRRLFGVPPSGGPDRLKPGLRTDGTWKAPSALRPCIGTMNHWPSRAGRKAPINRTHSKRFALADESADHAVAFGVRASSAPLSQGRLQFDGRAGSWRARAIFCAHCALESSGGSDCCAEGNKPRYFGCCEVHSRFWLTTEIGPSGASPPG